MARDLMLALVCGRGRRRLGAAFIGTGASGSIDGMAELLQRYELAPRALARLKQVAVVITIAAA